MQHVIIGNGIAGIQAAETLRQLDSNSRIILISDEDHPPYSRPMISLVLEGRLPWSDILYKQPDFYEQRAIETVFGRRVTSVDPLKAQVMIDHANSSGQAKSIDYDRLLIASGADPRPIAAEGLDWPQVFYLRNLKQVREMEPFLKPGGRALVLGGGLVGFKAATALMKRGMQVTMLIQSDHPLSMQLDTIAGKMVLDELLANGLDVRINVQVTAFEGQNRLQAAQLDDGTRLACDLAVIGKGVRPARSFIPAGMMDIDLGIRVDQYLQTSCPGIYAAGDAAECWDIARQRPWVNAIWPEAAEQGRVAGLNMTGWPTPYPGSIGRNMIRIYSLDIMTCGLVNPSEKDFDILTSHEPTAHSYRKLVFQGDCLVGAVLVNGIEQSGLLAGLIRSQTPVSGSKERLFSRHLNWKQLNVY